MRGESVWEVVLLPDPLIKVLILPIRVLWRFLHMSLELSIKVTQGSWSSKDGTQIVQVLLFFFCEFVKITHLAFIIAS